MDYKQELIDLIMELNEANLIDILPTIFKECNDGVYLSCDHCPLHNQERNDFCDRFHAFV